jgi:hypothetical protein
MDGANKYPETKVQKGKGIKGLNNTKAPGQ